MSPTDLIYCDETSHLGSSNYSPFLVARYYARYSCCPSFLSTSLRCTCGLPEWCEFLNWRSGCCQNKAAAQLQTWEEENVFAETKRLIQFMSARKRGAFNLKKTRLGSSITFCFSFLFSAYNTGIIRSLTHQFLSLTLSHTNSSLSHTWTPTHLSQTHTHTFEHTLACMWAKNGFNFLNVWHVSCSEHLFTE